MKVTVKDLRTDTVREMNKKFADILVKAKRAVYWTPEEVKKPAPAPKPEAPKENKQLVANTDIQPQKKKPGRPPKQTYETKDMVAK